VEKATDILILHEVEAGLVDNDIRRFIKYSFLEVANRRSGLDGWPTEEQLELLCERAGGLFIKTTDDGWVLNSNGKRLLWLPPHWRVDDMDKVWSARFLAFLHHQLPEAVILEVLEE